MSQARQLTKITARTEPYRVQTALSPSKVSVPSSDRKSVSGYNTTKKMQDTDDALYEIEERVGDTETFPGFIDFSPQLMDPKDLHCTLHCNHRVCKKIRDATKHPKPVCKCLFREKELKGDCDVTPMEIQAMLALSDDHPIVIFRSDVEGLIDEVANDQDFFNIRDLALSDEFRADATGKHHSYRIKAARTAQEALTTVLKDHFARIFSSPLERMVGMANISRTQLKLDITAVLGITMWEFMGEFFGEQYCGIHHGRFGYVPRKVSCLMMRSGVANAVWFAWDDVLDALIKLLTLKHVRYTALIY